MFCSNLIKQGYSVIAPSGNPSTVYDYIKRIDKVIEWEHLYSWDELAKNISKYVSQYGIGGIKQDYAHGYKPYYFNSKKQGELDFLIEYHGEILPIEVKSGKGYTVHSALNNVLSNEDYGIKQAFVFANCNVTINEKIVYYPIYFCMFLQERDLILPKIPKVVFSQI